MTTANLKIATDGQIVEVRAFVAATTYAAYTRVCVCDCCGDMHVCADVGGIDICDSCLVSSELESRGLRFPTEHERAMAIVARLAEESAVGFGV